MPQPEECFKQTAPSIFVYSFNLGLLIIKAIKNKFNDVIEPRKNDICYATTNRQEAVKKIASSCEVFFVIGAYNSSNSIQKT